MGFGNRSEAGRRLAIALAKYKDDAPVVPALPRMVNSESKYWSAKVTRESSALALEAGGLDQSSGQPLTLHIPAPTLGRGVEAMSLAVLKALSDGVAGRPDRPPP